MRVLDILKLCPSILLGSLMLLAFLVPAQLIHSQPYQAPLGKWTILADGRKGSLNITSFNDFLTSSNIAGTIKLGSEPIHKIVGFYNDKLGRIIFIGVVNSTILGQDQIFTGYMMVGSLSNLTSLAQSCSRTPGGGSLSTHTLVGYFESLAGPRGLVPRAELPSHLSLELRQVLASGPQVRGWYAIYSYCARP